MCLLPVSRNAWAAFLLVSRNAWAAFLLVCRNAWAAFLPVLGLGDRSRQKRHETCDDGVADHGRNPFSRNALAAFLPDNSMVARI
jgi:hypothetical protein